jgi:hypothetical protein
MPVGLDLQIHGDDAWQGLSTGGKPADRLETSSEIQQIDRQVAINLDDHRRSL